MDRPTVDLPEPYYDDGGVVLYHGDCLEILPALEPVDHVITDPPYSEHVHTKSRAGARMLPGSGSPANFARAVEFGFASMTADVRLSVGVHCGRLARRWVAVFSDVESTQAWREAFSGTGVEYVRTGAWVKVNGTPQFTGDRPAVGFEAITLCHRVGRKRWNGGGRHGVWRVPIVIDRGGTGRTRCHPTQKPEPLMAALVADFTDPDDVILDPFAGSGTTLVAAKRLGRQAIGIEQSAEYCEIAATRLAQGVLSLNGH